MKILLISRVTLPPNLRGNAQYTLSFIERLKYLGHEVEIAVTEGQVATPPMWDMPPTPEEMAFAQARIRNTSPNMVIVNYTFLCDILALTPKGCLRGVLTHDARHLRYADFLAKKQTMEFSPWTEIQEKQALAHADIIIAIQEKEKSEFLRLAPHATVLISPCTFTPQPLPLPAKKDTCLFIGSDADHNLYGMQWFLNCVWPTLLESCPTATLDICGTVNIRLQTTQPNVTMHGRIDDLSPVIKKCAVGIVPLLAGSGCKLKMIETLSQRRPCVSTSVGIDGMNPKPDGVLVADSPKEFRNALLSLFSSPPTLAELANRGLDYATKHHHPKAQLDVLKKALTACSPLKN